MLRWLLSDAHPSFLEVSGLCETAAVQHGFVAPLEQAWLSAQLHEFVAVCGDSHHSLCWQADVAQAVAYVGCKHCLRSQIASIV